MKRLPAGARTRNTRVHVLAAWLGLALLALGALAYLAPRPFTSVPGVGAVVGSWPTFAHVGAMTLLTFAVLGVGRRALLGATATWTAFGLAAEALQHPAWASLAFPGGGAGGRFTPASYAHRGTFDPVDLVAAVLGGLVAGAVASILLRRARAAAPRRPPAPRHHPLRLGARLTGGGLAVLGIASTLATSPPPYPTVELRASATDVCEGASLTLTWEVGQVDAGEEVVLRATPLDAFEPSLAQRSVVAPGSLDVTVRRTGRVAAGYGPYEPGLHDDELTVGAMPCDASGWAYPLATFAGAVAVAADAGSNDLAVLIRHHDETSRLERRTSEGRVVWSRTLEGTPTAVAFGPDGGLFVASNAAADEPDEREGRRPVLLRFSPSGVPDGERHLASFVEGAFVGATALAVDATGAATVLSTVVREGYRAFEVTALDPALDVRWRRAIDAGQNAYPRAVTVDGEGRPFVVGASTADVDGSGTAGARTFVLALDPADGTTRWARSWPDWNYEADVAFDPRGRVLVVAQDLHALSADDGALEWTAPHRDDHHAAKVAVDDAGRAVVAGTVPGGVRERLDVSHLYVERYDGAGERDGERTVGTTQDDRVRGLVWSGGVVLTGTSEGRLFPTAEHASSGFVLRLPVPGP